MAAELLGVTDIDEVQRVATAWLHLYFFVLGVDDAIDVGRGNNDLDSNYIANCLLLQKGISKLIAHSRNARLLSAAIDRGFQITAKAAIRELARHRNRVALYRSKEVWALGEKIGFLHICAGAIADLTDHPKAALRRLTSAFKLLSTAIQLLDDLTDWEEDLNSNSQTLPITLNVLRSSKLRSVRTLVATAGPRPDNDATFASMIETGALEDTLRFAIKALRKTVACVTAIATGDKGAPVSKTYLQQLLCDCENTIPVLIHCRTELNKMAPGMPSRERYTAIRRRILRHARRALFIIAQKS